MGYFDNQGAQPTKVTWDNPEIVPEEKRQNGGWYVNPSSNMVERWWAGDQAAPAPANGGTGGASVGSAVSGITGTGAPAVPDLTDLYKQKVSDNPEYVNINKEIDTINKDIAARKADYEREKFNINDNPYYSSGTMSGKINRLDNKFQGDVQTANQRLSVAQARQAAIKADAEVQLNLIKGQYDLKNQAYQNTLAQFDKMLSNGSLRNANESDIAQIAVATGMPVSQIKSAIEASKVKDLKVDSWTDGTNDYLIVYDGQGNIVTKNLIGKSKAAATNLFSTDPTVSSFIQAYGSAGNPVSNVAGNTNYNDLLALFNTIPAAPTVQTPQAQTPMVSYLNQGPAAKPQPKPTPQPSANSNLIANNQSNRTGVSGSW